MNPLEIDNWIKNTLKDAQSGNTTNILDINKIGFKAASDFKEMRKDLINEEYPIIEPHWNLNMADWNPEENGIYLLIGVNKTHFILSVGCGDAWEIKSISNHSDLNETDEITNKLKISNYEKKRLVLERAFGELWLESL